MKLTLERNASIRMNFGRSSGNRFETYEEIFVLSGTTPASKEIPKQAGFRWDSEGRRWWTTDEGSARQLAQYAQNGLRERWGLPPAVAVAEPPAVSEIQSTPAAPVVGTEQQEAFWREIVDGSGHIVLMARAGCGKTFSVVEASKRAKAQRIGFCAFNGSIAAELRQKVPSHTQAITLHALGFAAVRRYNVGKQTRLDKEGKKVAALIERLSPPEWRVRNAAGQMFMDKQFMASVAALVSLCKSYLVDGAPEELTDILKRHEIEMAPSSFTRESRDVNSVPKHMTFGEWEAEQDAAYVQRIFNLVPRVLQQCKADTKLIDYDDQIWLPVVLNMTVENYDLLFIDEAQDMNLCQQKLAFKACPNGRIVIVGDDRQSIYAFRGADTRSMERMRELLAATPHGCEVMPLTKSRRCGKVIITEAQTMVPDIEAMDDAPEGVIEHIDSTLVAARAGAGDMILCRTNAPLIRTAYELLRAGKKPVLKGRDLGARLRGFLDRLKAQDVSDLTKKVAEYRAQEIARLTAADKSAMLITQVEDDCDTVDVLLEGCANLQELNEKIRHVFDMSDTEGAVSLSSVHGAKGLEADTVFILRPDLMPHPKATKPEDAQQEENIRYVAVTRAKTRLIFAHDKPAESKPAGTKGEETGDSEYLDFGDALPLDSSDLRPEDEGYDVYTPEQLAADAAPEAIAELEAISDSVQVMWRDEVRSLLRQAQERTPFDETVLTDAIEHTLSLLTANRSRSEVRS